jgi:hypothetical protein
VFDNISILDCQENSEILKNWGCWTIFVPKNFYIFSTETGLLLLLKNLSAYDDYIDWDLTKLVLPCTM